MFCNDQSLRTHTCQIGCTDCRQSEARCAHSEAEKNAKQKEESSCLFDGAIKGLFMFISHLKRSHKTGDCTHKPSNGHKSPRETDRAARLQRFCTKILRTRDFFQKSKKIWLNFIRIFGRARKSSFNGLEVQTWIAFRVMCFLTVKNKN